MPVLANPKHEAFAQARAKGKTFEEAYVLAGYKAHAANAQRMSKNEIVQARIVELQEATAKRTLVTAQSLTDELEEIRVLAIAAGQYSAAKGAVMGKAQINGKLVTNLRHEGPNGGPVKIDVSGMSREQLEASIETLSHLASISDDADTDDEGGASEA